MEGTRLDQIDHAKVSVVELGPRGCARVEVFVEQDAGVQSGTTVATWPSFPLPLIGWSVDSELHSAATRNPDVESLADPVPGAPLEAACALAATWAMAAASDASSGYRTAGL
ncbi:hypothetical protein GCM10023166_29780 [Paeniglutamicibacter cryotolerans]